jgi:hypothetical protein
MRARNSGVRIIGVGIQKFCYSDNIVIVIDEKNVKH